MRKRKKTATVMAEIGAVYELRLAPRLVLALIATPMGFLSQLRIDGRSVGWMCYGGTA